VEGELRIQWGNLGYALPDLEALVAFLGPGDFPEYTQAADELAAHAERLYKGYCLGEPTPSGRTIARPSGALARSVHRDSSGPLLWILRNDAPYAKGLEEGLPERDMKKDLATSPRARRAKDGSLYLIIPFRHGVPGSRGLNPMPRAVYRQAQALAHSRTLGAPSARMSATGFEVPRFTYRWNGRLSAGDLSDTGMDEATVRRHAGIVRMGRQGQTSYMTFRVMSEKSPQGSWVRPATPGLWPMKWALEVAWSEGIVGLEMALERDLLDLIDLAPKR
jgi:hypothetical protein